MTVIVSVPHSGTQSLLRYLRDLEVEPGKSEGPAHIYHFGVDDAAIATCPFALHIPIRNPIDTAASWINRGKNLAALFASMESMAGYAGAATWHITEQLPLVLNTGPDIGAVHDRLALARTLADNVSTGVLALYRSRGGYVEI